jgi:TolB-like protein/Flp pilus assembly protein TadD
MQLAHEAALSVGRLDIRPATREVVWPGGREVLQPRVMQMLVTLARARGLVVSRDDLIRACWDGRIVGDGAITQVLMKLRKLASRTRDAFVIETIAKVGYRLAASAAAAEVLPSDPAGRLRPRIAVLKFGSPAGDDAQLEFAEALADDLIAGLSKSPLLAVMPRQTSLTYDATGQQTSEACAALGVDYLLHGSVRLVGQTLRVSTNLVHGADDTSAWSSRYDRPITDLFAVLDEITGAIVGALEPAVLRREEAQVLRVPEHHMQFWQLFVRARRHFWQSTAADVRQAEALLDQALALEPNDASALAILAHCKLYGVWVGDSEDFGASVNAAHAIALKAVSADNGDAFAHYTLGVVLSLLNRLAHAKAEQRRALELNPYLAAALGELGRLQAFAGEYDDAIAYSDRAIAASPNDPHAWLWFRNKAIARFGAGEYAQAALDAADACARGPYRPYLHTLLAACYSADGDMVRARRAFQEAQRLAREESARSGRPQDGDRAVRTQRSLRIGHPFVDPAHLERFVEAVELARTDTRVAA